MILGSAQATMTQESRSDDLKGFQKLFDAGRDAFNEPGDSVRERPWATNEP